MALTSLFQALRKSSSRKRKAICGPLTDLQSLEQRFVLAAQLSFNDSVEGIAVDASENKYVYYRTLHGTVDLDPSAAGTRHVTGSAFTSWNDDNGRYLVKYSPDNEVLWVKPMAELPGRTGGSDLKVAIDDAGVEHLYAFGGSVSKLTLAGETVWTQETSTSVLQSHVDADGSVYATGYILNGSADLDLNYPWVDGRDLLTAKGQGIFVAKWSAKGELQWSRAIDVSTGDTGGSVWPGDIAVSSGIVYVGATFNNGTLSIGGLTDQRVDSSSSRIDGFVATYDTSGTYRSVAHFIDGEVNYVRVVGNEVYLTATFGYTTDMDPGPGQKLLTPINYNGDALAVAKLTYSDGTATTNASWTLNWAHGFASTFSNVAGGLQVSGSNVYISGMFGDTTDFNPDPSATYNLTAGGRGDIFVLNLGTNNGSLQWVSQIGSTVRLAVSNQEIATLVVGASGTLHLGGHIALGPVHFNGSANPILLGGLDTDAFIGKIGADGSFQDAFNIGATSRSMDNGDPGYTEVGSWRSSTNGWEGDSRSSAKGSGADKARWTFTNLPNGTYQIITRFPSGNGAASNAPFRVNGVLATVDQKTAPNDYNLTMAGNWENVGRFTVANGTLQVELSDAANGTVIADAIRIWAVTPAAALAAASAPPASTVANLTIADVESVYAEAVARWKAAGADTSALADVSFQITDLPALTLGQATTSTILFDTDAAGWGWFVDTTPEDDGEFLRSGNQGEQYRIDLLTVMMHEMGHILGAEHDEHGLMADTLDAGTRHSPESSSDMFFVQLGEEADSSLWLDEDGWLKPQRRRRR